MQHDYSESNRKILPRDNEYLVSDPHSSSHPPSMVSPDCRSVESQSPGYTPSTDVLKLSQLDVPDQPNNRWHQSPRAMVHIPREQPFETIGFSPHNSLFFFPFFFLVPLWVYRKATCKGAAGPVVVHSYSHSVKVRPAFERRVTNSWSYIPGMHPCVVFYVAGRCFCG